jgi:hypothetical protein
MSALTIHYAPLHPYAQIRTLRSKGFIGAQVSGQASVGGLLGDIFHTVVNAAVAPVNVAIDVAQGDFGDAGADLLDPGRVRDTESAQKVAEGAVWVGGKIAIAGAWVYEHGGDAAVWLYEHDPILQFGAKVLDGENVWDALKETGAIILQDIAIFGPYAAYIPGLGTAAAMCIAAGVALANGKRITDILISAARGAIPPGPALMAFDAANCLIHGGGLGDAAIAALKGELPEEMGGLVDGINSMLQGGSLSDAVLTSVRGALTDDAMKAAFDAGLAIARGKRVQDALLDGVRGVLPPEYQAIYDQARAVANGKNVFDAVIDGVIAELPPEAQKYAKLAARVAKGEKVITVLMDAALALIPGDYAQYFKLAMDLLHANTADAVKVVLAKIPAGTAPEQALDIARQAQSGGRSLALGASVIHRLGPVAFTGGVEPKRTFKQVGYGAAVGASAVVSASLEAAIKVARAKIPAMVKEAKGSASDLQLAYTAFDAGVKIVRGQSVEAIAMAAAKQYVPEEYKKTFDTAAAVTKRAVNGDNLGDVALDTFRSSLPPEALQYADLGLGLVKGERSQAALLKAARLAVPANLQSAFDAALVLTDEKADFRTTIVATVRSQIPNGTTPEQAFTQAVDFAKAAIPDAAVEKARAAVGTLAGSMDLFNQAVDLAKNVVSQQVAIEVLKDLVPQSYQDAYHQAATIASHANPSAVVIGALRSQLPLDHQHAVDGTSALFRGGAPESQLEDPLLSGIFARVLAYKRFTKEIPPVLLLNRDALSGSAQTLLDERRRMAASMRMVNVGGLIGEDPPLRAPSLVIPAEPAPEEFEQFNQALHDIALRRASLGVTNKYQGTLDPWVRMTLFELARSYQKTLPHNESLTVKKAIAAAKTAPQGLASPAAAEASSTKYLFLGGAAVVVAGGALYWKKRKAKR